MAAPASVSWKSTICTEARNAIDGTGRCPSESRRVSCRNYGFGEADTDGAALAFGEATGVVAGATETAADAAGLVAGGAVAPDTLAAGDAVADPLGLAVAVPAAAGVPEADAPGTGVAEAAGAGVCPFVSSRLRLLPVFALCA